MTAQETAILMSLLEIIKSMSGWQCGVILFTIIIGPWLFAMALMYFFRKRFEAVVEMYESNVRLVEKYELIANDMRSVVEANTAAMTRVCDRAGL